jgi:hypothetical protein
MDTYISQEALLFFLTARKNDEFLKTTNPSPHSFNWSSQVSIFPLGL